MKLILLFFFLLFSSSLYSSNDCEIFHDTLNTLSGDELEGRVGGTSGNLKTRIWLIKRLEESGLKVITQGFKGGMNIFGILNPAKALEDTSPSILLSTHYDGQKHCEKKNYALSSVCNSASDASAGLAVILAVVNKLKDKIRAPLLVAFFDREEEGLLGSRALISKLHEDPKMKNIFHSLKVMLNLDIIGLNLFKGIENNHITMGAETGGKELVDDLRTSMEKANLNHVGFSYALTHKRSDITSFVISDMNIPVIHFTDGDGSIYHSSGDEEHLLNQKKMQSLSNLLQNLIFKINNRENKYPYYKPTILNGMALPLFTDVLKGLNLVQRTIKVKEMNDFSLSTLETLMESEVSLKNIHKMGIKKFGQQNMFLFSKTALDYTALSRNQSTVPMGSPCEPIITKD